jgi:outer membrane protein OmpA-like peptidoglycan-associated protein
MTADSGVFRIKLNSAQNYGVEITSKDYLFFLDAVDMTKSRPDEAFNKDFYLDKIEVGKKVVLENIYFQTGKAVLTDASFPQLNSVIDFLKSNETVKLEISGHTDNVGSLKANTTLSANRAKAVVAYLAANGIPADRLASKGYGFSQPIAPNNTPDGREKNRRVEFKILSK